MKKFLIILTILTSICVFKDLKSEKVIIPKESIRFRVIANSNSKEDQELKLKVKNNLQENIKNILKEEKDINNARLSLEKNIPVLK